MTDLNWTPYFLEEIQGLNISKDTKHMLDCCVYYVTTLDDYTVLITILFAQGLGGSGITFPVPGIFCIPGD